MALTTLFVVAVYFAVAASQGFYQPRQEHLQLNAPRIPRPRSLFGFGGFNNRHRPQSEPQYQQLVDRNGRNYKMDDDGALNPESEVAPAFDDNALPQRQPQPRYNSIYPLTPPQLKFRFGAISDMDQNSKDLESMDPNSKWMAFLKEGSLILQQSREDPTKSNVTIEWDEGKVHTLKSGLAYSGRGMELSTLNVFNGKLYSCDDRTGVIYELPMKESMKIEPVPWAILANGNFTGTKGFKCEWGTVKDGDFWVGGHGKDDFNKQGEVVSKNEKFVKRITPAGAVTHLDWTKNFEKMSDALGVHLPGYVIHEAAGWSDTLQKWIFMPRKVSKEKFDPIKDIDAGSNVVLLADENFDNVEVTHIGALVPTHGFASFKFIPGTEDQMIVALKSMETEENAESFIMAFDLKGNVLLEETKFADQKFEGVEFL